MKQFNSKKQIITASICLLIALCLLGFSYYEKDMSFKASSESSQGQAVISIGQAVVVADIADTNATREQGLGGRTSLLDNQGMFFMFDTPGLYSFWMKDMVIPIDMIWLDQNLKVIYIESNVSPSTFPSVFTPTSPAMYVLEVQSGFAQKNAVKIGDTAKIISIGAK